MRSTVFLAAIVISTACCVRADEGPAAPAAGQVTAPAREAARHFTTGFNVRTIACSPDGKLIAVANGGPTFVLQENGVSKPKDGWQPSVEILDSTTGKTIAVPKLATDEEDK